MRLLLLFLDGVGIGTRDPKRNPFLTASLPTLHRLLGHALPTYRERSISSPHSSLMPLDATLGVPGLPQSGTGQVSLFTGVNAARIIGRHFGPHPYSTLRPLLNDQNIFARLLREGKSVRFANAFPDRFFEFAEARRSRLTATTSSCLAAGVPILREPDLLAGTGISADITGAGWHALGHPAVTPVSPVVAGERLGALMREFDFVLFEYWRTDHAGHSMRMDEAIDVLEIFDAFLDGVVRSIDLHSTLIVLTSDHGNIEDMSIKTHTRHPVPLLAIGHHAGTFVRRIHRLGGRRPDLTAVTPAILESILERGS
jgi:2,3-bisphosphoglycerate-independent phosphoglycerate mutase